MNASGIDQLTEMERVSLRAIFEHRHEKVAALAIGRSENTLRAHLASSRRKLGTSSSFAAAKALHLAEDHCAEIAHPNGISTEWGMAEREPCTQVREDRAIFEHLELEVQQARSKGDRINDLNRLPKLVLVAIAMTAVVALFAMTFALSDGLQRWANIITAYRNIH